MSVAVTGWAWRTALGHDVDVVMERLFRGERAARGCPRFLHPGYGCQLAAPIDDPPKPSRHRRVLRRMGLFGLEAAREAASMAGVEGGPRVGVFCAYGGLRPHLDEVMPMLKEQRDDLMGSWERGFTLLHPFWMLLHLSNNAHALASLELGARGDGVTYGGANASALAVAGAERALECGALDVAVVLAFDSLIEPEKMVELVNARLTTDARLEDLVAPYGPEAAGFIPGEAAAAVVVERAGAAGSRARAYLRAADAADGSSALPDVTVLARAARRLLVNEREGAARIGLIDGAALAQAGLDDEERRTLASLGIPDETPLTAVQAALGQVGAAAGLVQTISLAEQLRRGQLAPVAHLQSSRGGPLRPQLGATGGSPRRALALACGSPGLAGALLVSLDPD